MSQAKDAGPRGPFTNPTPSTAADQRSELHTGSSGQKPRLADSEGRASPSADQPLAPVAPRAHLNASTSARHALVLLKVAHGWLDGAQGHAAGLFCAHAIEELCAFLGDDLEEHLPPEPPAPTLEAAEAPRAGGAVPGRSAIERELERIRGWENATDYRDGLKYALRCIDDDTASAVVPAPASAAVAGKSATPRGGDVPADATPAAAPSSLGEQFSGPLVATDKGLRPARELGPETPDGRPAVKLLHELPRTALPVQAAHVGALLAAVKRCGYVHEGPGHMGCGAPPTFFLSGPPPQRTNAWTCDEHAAEMVLWLGGGAP